VLGIWDTAGQERFRPITSSYYQHADGAFLLYDIADAKSWSELKESWLPAVGERNPGAFLVVIANKQDLRGLAVVENSKAEKWCKENDLHWIKASATEEGHAESSFGFMVTKILERKRQLGRV